MSAVEFIAVNKLSDKRSSLSMVMRNTKAQYLKNADGEEYEQDAKDIEFSNETKIKRKYPQRYKVSWEQNRTWLTQRNGQAYCRACSKQLVNNSSLLLRHENTKKHKRKESECGDLFNTNDDLEYYSTDEQDDNESSEADNLLKPVITKVEVVKEDKTPIRKKRRDTIIPSSFRYKVDDTGEDEFDVIGKNVANKLRKLAPDTQMYAEKLVMDVIFQAQIGNIYKNSVLQIINCESQQPSSQPSSSAQSDCQISVNIASLANSTPKNMTNFE